MNKEELQKLGSDVLANRDNYSEVRNPIYILSKGRPKSATIQALCDAGVFNWTIFVEQEDYDSYFDAMKLDCIEVLPKSNQGIVYVRNYIKQYSLARGEPFHWQMDDNIKNFRIRENNKNIKHNALSCLAMCEDIVGSFENIGVAGLGHTAFAFGKPPTHHISINKQVYSCVLVDNNVPVTWTEGTVEDTDYSLQVLTRGLCTLLFDKILIEKEVTKVGNGGNNNSDEWRLARTKKLQEDWPVANFKYTQQYGRVKVLPSRIWRQFPQVPMIGGEVDFFDKFLSD
jgi:hypothetical protein